MALKILSLEEYEEKSIIINKEDFDQLNRNSKYYIVKFEKISSPNEIKITLKARFYIGLIKITPNLQLIIRPKIKAADFIAILQYVDKKRIKTWQKLLDCIEKEKNFIDYFLGLFLKETNKLLKTERKRGYSCCIEERYQPKGKILISNTLKNRKILLNKIICQHHQYTLNTPYNQIIKYTLNYIKNLISPENFIQYRQNLALLKNVDTFRWNSIDIENLPYNRINFHYKPIHDLCRMILDNFSLKFQKGKDKFFAFVINSWNVYEIFLREIYIKFQSRYKINAYKISDITDDIDWDNKDPKNRRPDIILEENGETKIFIDAKYKMEFTFQDYDQMNTYITQTARIPYGELIYPKGSYDQKENIIGTHEKVKVRYIDMSRVSNQDYLKRFVSNSHQEYCSQAITE